MDHHHKKETAMTGHTIGTREQWQEARAELLEREKELMRSTRSGSRPR